MKQGLYRIPIPLERGALSIVPRPRGGDWLEDELKQLRRAGVTAVVSMLEPAEERELDLTQERPLAVAHGLEFFGHPVPDRGVPNSRIAFDAVVQRLVERLNAGAHVAVHCRQSVGRSSLVVISILLRLGVTLEQAVVTVAAARGLEVPETPQQRAWLAQA